VTPRQARRIRFGILAARDTIERWRLTDDQTDYLEGHYGVGWRKEDAWAAYKREACKAAGRVLLNG
jgi:hypothetical protein